MEDPTRSVPPASSGYLLSDLQRFAAAADERCEAMRAAIALARARRDAALAAMDSAHDARWQIAESWLAAVREANSIREAAEHEARVVLEQAEATARAVRARTLLTQPRPIAAP